MGNRVQRERLDRRLSQVLLNVDVVLHRHLQNSVTRAFRRHFNRSPSLWNLRKQISRLVLATRSLATRPRPSNIDPKTYINFLQLRKVLSVHVQPPRYSSEGGRIHLDGQAEYVSGTISVGILDKRFHSNGSVLEGEKQAITFSGQFFSQDHRLQFVRSITRT